MSISLTASQKFLLFWVSVIGGLIIGSQIQLPIALVAWLLTVWLVIFISGQESTIELLALVVSALLVGVMTWQLTGGETWVKLGWLANLSDWLIYVRNQIIDRIFLTLPEPHGSLLSGILLGNRIKLDKELLETFRVVGLSHIIAVSGYNLSILTANTESLLRPYLGRKTIYLGAVLILLFVVITGAPASILRAAVMAAVVLLAKVVGRPNRSMNSLILAAGFLALFEPKIIMEIGFQLSLAATYGLIRLAPLFGRALEFLRLPEWLLSILAQTLAATIMTAPLILIYFERLSVISPLTNILVVPLIPLLMGLGLVSLPFLFVWPVVGQLLIWLTWPILAWINQVANLFTRLPFATTNAELPIWVLGLVMTVLVVGTEILWSNLKTTISEELRLKHALA